MTPPDGWPGLRTAGAEPPQGTQATHAVRGEPVKPCTSLLSPQRRTLLGAGLASVAWSLGACRSQPQPPPATWAGSSPERGHRLRRPLPPLSSARPLRRAGALVLGGGVAGLAALRALHAAGVQDTALLELEDSVGGNSRAHVLAGQACPVGAHYLPVPGPAAREVSEWLHEIGLMRFDALRGKSLPDERHLAHAPNERLWIDGQWQDGLLASIDGRPALAAQAQRFAQAVSEASRLGFAMPTQRAPFGAAHAALDAQTFAYWLQAQGLNDLHLLAYLDYACRDDYGAGLHTVSAWAGLHYFASRHGFKAPGTLLSEAEGRSEGVFTWPEGNAWLVERLAAPLRANLHPARTVLRVEEGKHAVDVWAFNETTAELEHWQAPQVVMALPLFVSARVFANPVDALTKAVQGAHYAPWLVTHLHLSEPLIDRPGMPPAWDSVAYAPAGSTSALGYVDNQHQSLRPDRGLHTGPGVISAYHALPESERAALYSQPAATWAQRVLADLRILHADIGDKVSAMALCRHGHAMRIPTPGTHSHPALAALRQMRGRIRFAHSELAGYSVFEEAFTFGVAAGAGGKAAS